MSPESHRAYAAAYQAAPKRCVTNLTDKGLEFGQDSPTSVEFGRCSPGPGLNGTPRKRTSSAAEVDHDDSDDGYECGRTGPGRADVSAAQAGGGAAAAARRGPGDGLALARGDGGGADRLA